MRERERERERVEGDLGGGVLGGDVRVGVARTRERVDGVLGDDVLVLVAEGGGVILIGGFVSEALICMCYLKPR